MLISIVIAPAKCVAIALEQLWTEDRISSKNDMPDIFHYSAAYIVTQTGLEYPVAKAFVFIPASLEHLVSRYGELTATGSPNSFGYLCIVSKHVPPSLWELVLRTSVLLIGFTKGLYLGGTSRIRNAA
jgi:hypothetical protein